MVEDYAPDEAAVEATFVNRDGAADVPIFLIGAPFWGILFGLAASWLRERHDMKPAPATETPRQTAAGSQEPTAR